jgi:Flp pilus assembly protein TadB
MEVVLGEMMTAAEKQSLPDTQPASSEPETSGLKSKRVKLTIYIAGAIIGIPFVTVLVLIFWVLINYFLVQR